MQVTDYMSSSEGLEMALSDVSFYAGADKPWRIEL